MASKPPITNFDPPDIKIISPSDETNSDWFEGFEPGATHDHAKILLANSFEDLRVCVQGSLPPGRRTRHNSKLNEIDIEIHGGSSSLEVVSSDISPMSEELNLNEEADQQQSLQTNGETIAMAPQIDLNSSSNIPIIEQTQTVIYELDSCKKHKKNIFVLSDAGKPIYARHGNEDQLVTIIGVMQALVSFVQDNDDTLRSVVSAGHLIVFMRRNHLILVAVTHANDHVPQVFLQLTYIYNQIISVLTVTQLDKIFKQKSNCDLRRYLTDTSRFMNHLCDTMDHDPGILLNAVQCLPLQNQVRDNIGQILTSLSKVQDIVFAILVAENQLIQLARMKKYPMHAADLHIVFNLVGASSSFQSGESWTPLCLPKFDPTGYLYSHISYLDDSNKIILLMLSINRNVFFILSDYRNKIKEKLLKHNLLKTITDSLATSDYNVSLVGISGLRHFMYKSRSTSQFTSPQIGSPYCTDQEKERLFNMYKYMHNRIHSGSRPLKLIFYVGAKETLLGWVTAGFELYATFSPLVTKVAAISAVNKLLRWIKREEDRLFVLNSYVF